jgi:Ribonuclease G/E
MNDHVYSEAEIAYHKRVEREFTAKRLRNQIDTWAAETRAELAAYEEREKLPNFGRF